MSAAVSLSLLVCTTSSWAGDVAPIDNLCRRGNQLSSENKIPEALSCFDQALKTNPNNFWAYFGRGKALVRVEDYPGALKALNKAVDLDPGHEIALAERARLYIILGNTKLAIADTKKAIAMEGKNPNWSLYQDLALLHDQTGDRKQSIIDCSESLRLNPKLLWGYYFRACQYMKLGQYQKAVDDLTFATTLHSSAETIKIYSLRADCYDKLGKHDLAIKDRKFAEVYVKDGWADSLLEPSDRYEPDAKKSK